MALFMKRTLLSTLSSSFVNPFKRKKILTFGSCLSRFTAEQYKWGKIIASVYHNRSDVFVGKFLDRDWVPYDLQNVLSYLKTDTQQTNLDNKSYNIICNQYEHELLGQHRIKKAKPFFELLKTETLDLIIMDGFIDLTARLATLGSFNKEGLFLRMSDVFEEKRQEWEWGKLLDIQESIANIQKIINFFKHHQPQAQIAFIHFPHIGYNDKPHLVERMKNYELLFQANNILIVPSLEVYPEHLINHKQHFAKNHYKRYACIINNHINKGA